MFNTITESRFLLVFAIWSVHCLAFNAELEHEWSHRAVLDANGKYVVHWTVLENEIIRFKVEVQTRGYVGFGLSENGAMKGSDIVTGWVSDSGVVSFQDRHGIGNSMPVIDASQDWDLHTAMENDTHTVLSFSRKLHTCDEDDFDIDESTLKLIYAYSDKDPKSSEQLQYHRIQRGSRRISLRRKKVREIPNLQELPHWDVFADEVNISSDTSFIYYCKLVKSPQLEQKHHIVKIETKIKPGHEAYLHHMTMFECFSDDMNKYEDLINQKGSECSKMKKISECRGFFASWAVGQEDLIFPDHVGMPLKYNTSAYYILQVHYDNGNLHNVVRDTSGLRLWYTKELRKYDAAIISMLIFYEKNLIIPPRQESYTLASHTSTECLKPAMPPTGINILGVHLHSHRLGRKMKVRHFRGNRELRPIVYNKYYDFNFQEIRLLPEEVNFLPDDQLTLECTYDSSQRTTPTFGGKSTTDEMCLAYFLYYPKIHRFLIYSMTRSSTLAGIIGEKLRGNASFYETREKFKQKDWSKVNISLLENAARFSPLISLCQKERNEEMENFVSYPPNFKPYRSNDSYCLSSRSSRITNKNGLTLLTFVHVIPFIITPLVYSDILK